MSKKSHRKSSKNYSWGDIRTSKELYAKSEDNEEQNEQESRKWNLVFMYFICFALFGTLIISLFNLQIIKGDEYDTRAKSNSIKEELISADRGVMFDRNGVQLVVNEPSFHVVLNTKNAPRMAPEEEWAKLFAQIYEDPEKGILKSPLPENLYMPELTEDGQKYFFTLAKLLDTKEEDLIKEFVEDFGVNKQKKVILKKDVSRDQQLAIKTRSDELKGVEILEVSDRQYPYKNLFTHVIGYTGEVSDTALATRDDLEQGDIVGKSGLELKYDEIVRGEKGKKLIEQDVKGRTVKEFVSLETAPVPGDSLYLTLDLEVQKKLHEVLVDGIKEFDATGAAAVVEDVETGEIIGLVSLPDYDPNLYIGGISYKDFNKINSDPNKPQLNRIISATYPPGSTYKTIVGSAALEEGAITENTYFNSTGVMYLGNRAFPEFGRKAWGRLNLIDGIAFSSNHYFCQTMLELGIDKFVPYAEWAGFGAKTGIDISPEASGVIPSPAEKLARPWLEPTWTQGDDCNSAIGQGITLTTPIQMVNWAATIGNGGYVMQPHLVHKVIDTDGNLVDQKGKEIVRQPKVSKKNLASIRKGMRQTVERSIVWPLKGAKVNVAAKTGTAQFGAKNAQGEYDKNHAWVITIFPYEKPKYSMVIFLEAGYASNNSAKVAREFIDWFAEYKGSGL